MYNIPNHPCNQDFASNCLIYQDFSATIQAKSMIPIYRQVRGYPLTRVKPLISTK